MFVMLGNDACTVWEMKQTLVALNLWAAFVHDEYTFRFSHVYYNLYSIYNLYQTQVFRRFYRKLFDGRKGNESRIPIKTRPRLLHSCIYLRRGIKMSR